MAVKKLIHFFFLSSIAVVGAEEIQCVNLQASETEQTFTSHGNYPANYKDFANDCWVIRATSDRYVHLEVLHSNIESNILLVCSWVDYIDVRDGDSIRANHTLRWCGNGIPSGSPFVSSGHALYVHFHSDYSINIGGFKMGYRSISEEEANHLRRPRRWSGRDEDESHPGPPHDQGDVDWRLQRPDDWYDDHHDRLHKGVIAAIAIGCVILLLLLAFGACFLVRCCKESQRREEASNSRSVVASTNLAPAHVAFTGAAVGGYVNRGIIPDSPTGKKKSQELQPPAYSAVGDGGLEIGASAYPAGGALHTESTRRSALPPLNASSRSGDDESFNRGSALPPIGSAMEATPEYTGPASPPPPYAPEYTPGL